MRNCHSQRSQNACEETSGVEVPFAFVSEMAKDCTGLLMHSALMVINLEHVTEELKHWARDLDVWVSILAEPVMCNKPWISFYLFM